MDNLINVINIFKQLSSTSSRIDKERILSENKDNELFLNILNFVYNPYILTGLSDKKINKNINITIQINPVLEDINQAMKYLEVNNSGRDIDIVNIQHFIRSHSGKDIQEFLKQIFTKNLKVGITADTINKIIPNYIKVFDVMLAKKYDDYKEKVKGKDFILTKKLDGNRLVVIKENGVVKSFTRQGNQYEGLEEIESDIKNLPYDYIVFDGELIADIESGTTNEIYAETTSKARQKGKNKTGLLFHIFDTLLLDEFQKGYSKEKAITRKNKLSFIFNNYNLPHCREVKPLYIGNDLSQIEVWKEYAKEQCWEGLMLNLDTPYVCKRTDTILKIKVMQTADLKILGFEEGTGKNIGRLGALIVNYKGFRVGVGTGLTDYDRDYIWNHKNEYLNKIAEIKYFEESKNQDGGISLRFPVYVKLRSEKTEESYN
jgi:DNA ligase-1